MSWPPDLSYSPPAVTDCSGGDVTGGLSTGDRLHQVPTGRLIAHEEVATLPTSLQPLTKPLSGVVPGLFGATCRCEQTAQATAIGHMDSGNWPAPLGAVARLSTERSVWVICTNGYLWGAVVQHSPMTVGPWHRLVQLPPGGFTYGGTPAVAPTGPGIASPGLAAFGPNRVVVIYDQHVNGSFPGFDYPESFDHNYWTRYFATPYDVGADGSFTPAGSMQSILATVSGVAFGPPHYYGRYRTMSPTLAVQSNWNGANIDPPALAKGIMAVGPTGLMEISSDSLLVEGSPNYVAVDDETGLGLFLTVETVGPNDGHGVPHQGLYAWLLTESSGGVGGAHFPAMSKKTALIPPDYCLEIHAPVCRLSRNRFLIAVRRLVYGGVAHPLGVVDIREFLVVNVDNLGTGLIPIEATFPYPDTPWGVDEILALEDADGTSVCYFSTLQPYESVPSPSTPLITLNNYLAFGLLSVLPDRVELPSAWAPGLRTLDLGGGLSASGFPVADPQQLVMGPVSPGVAAAAYNVGSPANASIITMDPLVVPAIQEPEAKLCFLTGMAGTPSAGVAGARLSPRSHQ